MPDLKYGSLSITGNYRKNNEDNLYLDERGRFFLVADGMGGQSAGEKASQLAVELIPRKLNQLLDFQNSPAPEKVLSAINEAVKFANSEIMALGRVDPDLHNMGTTVVLVAAVGPRFFIGNVGDSRCYLLRDNTLTLLTKDHSLTQALVEAGTISPEEARTHRYKNVLYRYLGSKEGNEGAFTAESVLQSGDRYLLCSDGVTDGLEDQQILQVLGQPGEPQQLAEELIRAAEQGGSRDNITCIVIQVD